MKRIIRGINKRNIITTSIIVLIFVMSLGYAALSQHMDLDGIATIDRSWIVKIKSMNCTTTGTAKVDSTNFISNTAVINGTLGDSSSKITCTIVLENQGNLKAKLGNVEVIEDDNKLITYSYTGVSEGTQLNPGESNTVTVTINYASGVTNIENTKKSVMLTFVYLENEPNTSNNPSPVPTSYEEYKVGDEVTLLDGSKWTVTKASGKDEGLVTLLSKALLTSSGEYTTDSTKAYKVAFGSGATEYDTFTSGNIGYFIDNTYLPKAKAALNAAGGTTINTKARLLTTDEYNALYSTPKGFATDSWDTIAKNIDSDAYQVGDTRKVTLEGFGTFTLRLANKSTPDACKDTENFSQTACGFVVEFTDIIANHYMNYSGTNSGGWEKSDMRTYINKDIYEALPDDLKTVIIETNVISGHESGASANYKTKDKLYLLAPHEVWAQGGFPTIDDDTAYDLTRQLDYYKNIGVTTSNYSRTIKYKGITATQWWLRTADSSDASYFYTVYPQGYRSLSRAYFDYGVSPAFRIVNVENDENSGNDGSIWGMTKCSRGFMSYSVEDSKTSSSCSVPTTTAYIQPVIITEKSNVKQKKVNTLVSKVLADNVAQSDRDIDFSKPSSDTNGQGLYYTSTNTEDNKTTYYFRGDVKNNYVYFAGYYWRIIRINEDGSVRMIYQGRTADATGSNATVGSSEFNSNNGDNGDVGYMHGKGTYKDYVYDYVYDDYSYKGVNSDVYSVLMTGSSGNYYVSDSMSFYSSDGSYYLSNWKSVPKQEFSVSYADYYGYYTALNYTTTSPKRLIKLKKVEVTEDDYGRTHLSVTQAELHVPYYSTSYKEAHSNNVSSSIKSKLDSWYDLNLSIYSSYISDSGFCNDRSLSYGEGYGIKGTRYGAYERIGATYQPQFSCPNASNDLFTVKNNKGNSSLNDPIGLITVDEALYAGLKGDSNNYLNIGSQYWTMTPRYYDADGYYVSSIYYISSSNISSNGSRFLNNDVWPYGVRPVINLNANVEITGGTGVIGDEYVIDTSK